MFRQDDNFSSRAPTFRSRSLTMLRAEVRADGVRGWLGPYLLAAPPPVESGDDFVDDGGVSSQDSRDSTSSANLLESEKCFKNGKNARIRKTSRTESAQNCITNFMYTGASVCGQKRLNVPISRHYVSVYGLQSAVWTIVRIHCTRASYTYTKVLKIVSHNTLGSRYQAGQNLFISLKRPSHEFYTF